MVFIIDEELRELAELFSQKKSKLYIVGGFIRNKILGIPDYLNMDIDLCSKSTPNEIKKILENTKFKIENINNDFGVIKIKGEKNIYEHATFRTEKYDFAGAHNPSNVEFIKDINTDALRRDFRCNSVYYDIYNDEIVDPLGGVQDIKNKIIRTTREPKIVFNDDSERILRMVRQAVTLGFYIDKKTYESAAANAFKVKYLNKMRIKKEFEQILLADKKYFCLPNTKFAHVKGISLLANLNILESVLPNLSKISKTHILDDKGNNLFDHILDVLKYCEEDSLELRLAILVHDYGKAETLMKYGNFFDHESVGVRLIEDELGENGLLYSKKTVTEIKNIVLSLDFDKYGMLSKKNLIRFIINNYMYINNIILLKKYISLSKNKKINYITKRLILIKNRIDQRNLPKTINDLNFKGGDVLEIYPKMKMEKIGEVMKELLDCCICGKVKNNFADLSKIAKKIVKKNNNYYMEV